MNHGVDPPDKCDVSAGCHINDVMNHISARLSQETVSAGCHINDVMNNLCQGCQRVDVSAGCHINDVMNSSYFLTSSR